MHDDLTGQELLRQRAFLSVREAAHLLGLAESTVRNQIWRGTFCLPTVKVGKLRRIRVSDLLALGATPAPAPRRRGRPRKERVLP